MSVKITESCIACGLCENKCPVEAIVDDGENPQNSLIFFVFPHKCIECIGHDAIPACATACPTEGCIVWEDDNGQHERHEAGQPVLSCF